MEVLRGSRRAINCATSQENELRDWVVPEVTQKQNFHINNFRAPQTKYLILQL
jgi:hypothetical protein